MVDLDAGGGVTSENRGGAMSEAGTRTKTTSPPCFFVFFCRCATEAAGIMTQHLKKLKKWCMHHQGQLLKWRWAAEEKTFVCCHGLAFLGQSSDDVNGGNDVVTWLQSDGKANRSHQF